MLGNFVVNLLCNVSPLFELVSVSEAVASPHLVSILSYLLKAASHYIQR